MACSEYTSTKNPVTVILLFGFNLPLKEKHEKKKTLAMEFGLLNQSLRSSLFLGNFALLPMWKKEEEEEKKRIRS